MAQRLTEAGKRLYYRANPGLAWDDGFQSATCREFVGPAVYYVHEVYLPKSLKRKIKFLRRWFDIVDRDAVPAEFRRRQTHHEFAEVALTVASRLDIILSRDGTMVAGSQHLCPVPWAIFGSPGPRFAQNQFHDFDCLRQHYKDAMRGRHYPQELYFRGRENASVALAKKHDMTPNLIIAIALLLLTDILVNCGPDCVELLDCFTNDYRVSSDNYPTEKWSQYRSRAIGGNAPRKERTYESVYAPRPVAYYNKSVKIIECKSSDDLAAGEKTSPLRVAGFFSGRDVVVPAVWRRQTADDIPTLADLSQHDDGYYRGMGVRNLW